MARYLYRSSVTGKFVSKKYAEKHPDITERETVGVVTYVLAKLVGK